MKAGPIETIGKGISEIFVVFHEENRNVIGRHNRPLRDEHLVEESAEERRYCLYGIARERGNRN